jgi:hypothetical protein
MREVLILTVRLLTTFAKLLRPGGVRAVAAQSLLLKHQLRREMAVQRPSRSDAL